MEDLRGVAMDLSRENEALLSELAKSGGSGSGASASRYETSGGYEEPQVQSSSLQSKEPTGDGENLRDMGGAAGKRLQGGHSRGTGIFTNPGSSPYLQAGATGVEGQGRGRGAQGCPEQTPSSAVRAPGSDMPGKKAQGNWRQVGGPGLGQGMQPTLELGAHYSNVVALGPPGAGGDDHHHHRTTPYGSGIDGGD
ncbi:unnamed protein product, partial [Discosporangium mesarthrocarpum]